jgi:glyoxylase-like metal-dependent hydrolase (beta-lactamase superfamily II)
MTAANIQTFFDAATCTATHVLACPQTGMAAIIDSVLDFEAKSGRTSTASADRVLAHVAERALTVAWHLETHAHADHLSAAPYLQQRLGGKVAIGRQICTTQSHFKDIFNASDLSADGSQFDHLFEADEIFSIGNLLAKALHTPGHTPACISYLVGDDVFIGDTLFMPDYGSARCDFPGGDPRALYRSIRKLLALPGATRMHLCHDYSPGGRAPLWQTTVAEQRAGNVHAHDGIGEDEFVAMRSARDRTLGVPALLLPAIQVNIRAGHWPPAESNGRQYLKIPLNVV